MRGVNFNFQELHDSRKSLDFDKINVVFSKSSLIKIALSKLNTSQDRLVYWNSIPSFLKVVIERKMAIDVDEITTIKENEEDNNVEIYSFRNFGSRDKSFSGKTIILTGDTMENLSKTKLASVTYSELQNLWGSQHLWTRFGKSQTYIQVGMVEGIEIAKGLVDQYDPNEMYDYYWVEKTYNQEYHLWATFNQKSLTKDDSERVEIIDLVVHPTSF